jgi:hypothetical protein
MKENKFLGALLPSSPDLLPIIQAVREKYNLPEINPDDDSITEIYSFMKRNLSIMIGSNHAQ